MISRGPVIALAAAALHTAYAQTCSGADKIATASIAFELSKCLGISTSAELDQLINEYTQVSDSGAWIF